MTETKFTYEELVNIIKERGIIQVQFDDNTKHRITLSDDRLFRLAKGKSRRGWYADDSHRIVKIFTPTKDNDTFNVIRKFKREALKANFTNDFIKSCLALPDTREQWENGGKKSPYELGVTTGCAITGKLISVATVAKAMGWQRHSFLDAVKNKTKFSSGTFPFQGYDGSASIEIKEDGQIYGYLSKEYKGCGNGYYYLLINDENFIGYDID